MPEDPDRTRTVAGDLAERATAVQEVVAGFDHAERVAIRIAQHDVPLLGQLADIEMACPHAQGFLDRGALLARSGAAQVQMQSIEVDLRGRRSHETQPDLPLVAWEQHAVVLGDDVTSE